MVELEFVSALESLEDEPPPWVAAPFDAFVFVVDPASPEPVSDPF
ncbi:hypothetical protein LPU83_2624 [Rhizobium favelukesii]|uniref:Uncharacterized protein n=1 Tax=Rhizobium favelukesii TaxID=348824 RepID=W6RAJ3_9HYPH|nr:hypothetical protein LPU83_2624 [Rhizobium favelukesii]